MDGVCPTLSASLERRHSKLRSGIMVSIHQFHEHVWDSGSPQVQFRVPTNKLSGTKLLPGPGIGPPMDQRPCHCPFLLNWSV